MSEVGVCTIMIYFIVLISSDDKILDKISRNFESDYRFLVTPNCSVPGLCSVYKELIEEFTILEFLRIIMLILQYH